MTREGFMLVRVGYKIARAQMNRTKTIRTALKRRNLMISGLTLVVRSNSHASQVRLQNGQGSNEQDENDQDSLEGSKPDDLRVNPGGA